MKRETIIFNGGLQTKVAPHLAQPNQAIECENIELHEGSICPMAQPASNEDLSPSGYSCLLSRNGTLMSSDIDEIRDYTYYGSRIYFTNGEYGNYGLYRIKSNDTIVDAVPPTVTAYGGITFGTPIANGNLDGDYSYVYTVVDEEGIESVPSPTYNVTATNQDIVINFGSDTVTETVEFRKIYRTGGNNPTFNLIGEVPSGTNTFTDNTRDIDVSRIELTSFDAYAPPTNLQYLEEANGTLWGAVGDRVYFSINGRPEFWNPLDYIVLNDTCTGIGVYRDTVLAFTDGDCYVIGGFSRDTITQERLPFNEGCLNNASISNITEFVVWTSKNGVCVYNGSTITVATKNILSWFTKTRIGTATFDSLEAQFNSNIGYQVSQAIGLDGKYYGVFQGGIGVFDIDKGIASTITAIDEPVGLYYSVIENSIAVITKSLEVYYLNTGSQENTTGRWRTPEMFFDNYEVKKQFRHIEFDVAPTQLDVYVDNKLIKQYNNKRRCFLPSGLFGRTISLDIYTDKEIRSVTIQYGVAK